MSKSTRDQIYELGLDRSPSQPSVCIPRIFNNITAGRIRSVFEQLALGNIHHIDIVERKNEKGEPFKRAYVHFDEEKRVHKNTGTKAKEEFPKLGAPPKNEPPVATNSYASVLAAPAPKPVTNAPKVVLPSVPVPSKLTIATTATLVNPWADDTPKRVTRLNWAAMDSDSEDEEDEEDEEEEKYVDATW